MQVGDIQRALVKAGFNPGPVDGVNGPKTAAALGAFQKANGLPASGTLDSKTQGALFGSAVTQADSFQAPKGQTFNARGTGYYPDKSALEGGFTDRVGKPLNTLQDYLSGKAPYVSVAMDSKAFPYGTKLRIPELEAKYGRPIDFRVVDTGSAFTGKGTGRIDICTANQKASLDPTINGPLTLVAQ
jgi:peptidoglycan hydrolase-like protein with peptidoglycan-binding domain